MGIKVYNLKSKKTGKAIPNQFMICTDDATYFQSYNSIILKAVYVECKRTLVMDKTFWNYSKTTSKYRNEFTGFTTKETKRKIDSGEIELVDLNQ